MLHNISVVVATKDRAADLRTLLGSLSAQTVRPAEVVIVDAGSASVAPVLAEFPRLQVLYIQHQPPSAAAQRNVGMAKCSPNSTLIGFVDDDATFEPQAFEKMLTFWNSADSDILGAAFNIRNYPDRGTSFFKRSALSNWLGLYSPNPGSVSRSGWQTIIPELPHNALVDWLPSTAVTFRREAFSCDLFDEFYESYSYLEDLDFSYSIGRKGKLAVVADAGYSHYPSANGRISARLFGLYESRNRLYFVHKHGLSRARCFIGLAIRWTMSIMAGVGKRNPDLLLRACGNLCGLPSGLSSRHQSAISGTSEL